MKVNQRVKKKKKKKAPAKKKATRKPPKKKAKKGPKKPTTAYAYFMKEKRKEFEGKYPGMKFQDLSKKMSEKWKSLGTEDRKEFDALNEKDKKRYEEEMKDYKPSSSESEDSSEGNKKKKKPRAKKRAKKDPNAPKQATNAYMYFQKDQRESIKQKYPELKTLPLMAKKMGEIWKSMDEQKKKPYAELAAKDKKRYEQDMVEYKKKTEEKKDDDDDAEDDDKAQADSDEDSE